MSKIKNLIKKVNKKDLLLYTIISALIVVIIGLILAILKVDKEPVAKLDIPAELEQDIPQELRMESVPRPIEKTEELIAAEQELEVVRAVEENDDGSISVFVKLKDVSELEEGLILHDFVDDIRFNKRIDLPEWSLEAMNGYLFPSKKKLNISTYGPGSASEKPTRINIVILDINFDKDSEETDLYEFIFKPDKEISEIIFSGAEIRSGKYILKLEEEIVNL